MAQLDGNLSSSSSIFIKSASDFEKELKTCLKWSKQQWNRSGRSGTRFSRLCSSINYWKNKLKPTLEDTSLVLTLYNLDNDKKTELVNIVNAIEEIDADIKVIGVTGFRNPRYLAFYFKSKEHRDKIFENFKMFNDSYVVYLAWAFDVEAVFNVLKVHWLPITINLDLVKKQLSEYVSVTLKEGVTVEKIPHIMNIENLDTLITIPGRVPFCLNCEEMGHISRNCKMRFCTSCAIFKIKDHQCNSEFSRPSFAEILKSKVNYENRADENDLAAAIEVQAVGSPLKEEKIIQERIVSIENQILILNAQHNNLESRNLNKDRKAENAIENFAVETGEVLNSERQIDEVSIGGIDTGSDVSVSDSEGEEQSMQIDNLANVEGTSVKNKKKVAKVGKRNKKKSSSLKKLPPEVNKLNSVVGDCALRSYGKPVYNTRKMKQQADFDKLTNSREFIFKD